jgi:long-chain acyl-CoA synthetase
MTALDHPAPATASTLSSTAPIPNRPVPALLEDTVRAYPDRPAIDFLGRKWNYAALGRLVDRAARGLQELGVGRDVKVGLCLPNTPYSIIFYYAVLKAGGIVVNFNPLYVERELKHQIEDSGTTVMVVMDLCVIFDKVAKVAEEAGLKKVIVCSMADVLPPVKSVLFRLLKRKDLAAVPTGPRFVRYAEVMAAKGAPRPVAIAPLTDVAVLQYTGGTTGVPKGAMLTHANITANSHQVVRHVWPDGPGLEKLIGILPLFHVFAMTCVMNVGIEIGAEIILLPRFEVKQALKTIARAQPTLLPGVPTLYTALCDSAEKYGIDTKSIRHSISGGAGLPQEVRMRFEKLTGCRLFEGYGLSETTPVVTINPTTAIRDGSAGVALDETVIEIRDLADPTKLLGPGENGEVCIRGPQVMIGYWQKPEETATAMIDGAFRSGDVGYLDADGYLYLVDRIKDLIICGGFNVYPHKLEEALYQHPAVLEAVVIGVPDVYRGQAPKAFVTLRDGKTATPEELRSFMAEYVSRIELPKQIEIRASLPKTAVGKLSKKELVAEELKALETRGAA